MVGGQMLDIEATEQKIDQSQLEDIHRRKTGALIRSAVISGALCSDELCKSSSNDTLIKAFDEYATSIGLAFQVVDDILDIESTTEELGKTSGADIALGKATYPSLIGLDASKELAEKLYQQAIASIATISDNTPPLNKHTALDSTQLLRNLADLVVKRRN